MGVSEDLESHWHEEELLFEREVDKVKVHRRLSAHSCQFATLGLGLLAAAAVWWHPSTRTGWAGMLVDRAPAACEPGGSCPLWALFSDVEVHEQVAENLVEVGSPSLVAADLTMVRKLVTESFRNISDAISVFAPRVANELSLLRINSTTKRHILQTIQLVSSRRVQGIGRRVAMAVRASPLGFTDAEDLKRHVVRNLWHELDGIQRFQMREVNGETRAIWTWGAEEQWEMTLDVEAMDWTEAISGKASSLRRPAERGLGDGLEAISGGALAEGRALLDVMLMCIRSRGPAWDADLRGSVDAFSAPLSTPCEPELTAEVPQDLRRRMICPLKFGMLGLDALRFTVTLAGKPERAGCVRPGICPLRGLFFARDVHEKVAKGLIRMSAKTLGSNDQAEVTKLVASSFRNISAALQRHASALGDKLNEATADPSTRRALLQATELLTNREVQAIGRLVAHTAKVSGLSFINSQRQLAENLWQLSGAAIREAQERLVPQRLRQIWMEAKEEHWQMAASLEMAQAVQVVDADGVPAVGLDSERQSAITGSALEEGRALLDAMLLCIRAKAPLSGSMELGEAAEVFTGPFSTRCGTGVESAVNHDLRGTLLCPLQLGMLGLDALRFSLHADDVPEDVTDLFTREPTSAATTTSLPATTTPELVAQVHPVHQLGGLFFDEDVQESVSLDIVGVAAEPNRLLGQTELPRVRAAVADAFGNISSAILMRAPALGGELAQLSVNATVKRYILQALQLMAEHTVQEIGRHVARALRAAPPVASAEELKGVIMDNLWRSFPEIQKLQAHVARWPVQEIWSWDTAHQWEMTFELEKAQSKASRGGGANPPLEAALEEAAWAEGRALLDLMLMCIRSKGPTWDTDLHGAVGASSAPLRSGVCDPYREVNSEAGLRDGLVCPLRFGMLGLDALRFTDSAFSWGRVDQRSCQDRGMCPLGRLFSDPYIHTAAAAEILEVALDEVPPEKVDETVQAAFRNISVHVHLYSKGAATALHDTEADEAEKEHFIRAMQLAGDAQVQAFGREVGRALFEAEGFDSPDALKRLVAENLGERRLASMRNYSTAIVSGEVLRLWRLGAEDQWTMTTDAEMVNSIKAAPQSDAPKEAPTPDSFEEQAAMVRGAALEQGRVLLDLMLMHARRRHKATSLSLFGAMDVFAAPLATVCRLDITAAQAADLGLRERLLCPLKFGALGMDGLRFAATAPPSSTTTTVSR